CASQEAGEEIMTFELRHHGLMLNTRRARIRQAWTEFVAAVAALSVLIVVVGADGAASKTRAHVQALASDKLEGRLAGSNGERLASDYIVAQLQAIGATQLPGQRDYRLPFEFTAGTRDGGSRVSIGARTFGTEADVRALSFS